MVEEPVAPERSAGVSVYAPPVVDGPSYSGPGLTIAI